LDPIGRAAADLEGRTIFSLRLPADDRQGLKLIATHPAIVCRHSHRPSNRRSSNQHILPGLGARAEPEFNVTSRATRMSTNSGVPVCAETILWRFAGGVTLSVSCKANDYRWSNRLTELQAVFQNALVFREWGYE
jgi:hypothetical protein